MRLSDLMDCIIVHKTDTKIVPHVIRHVSFIDRSLACWPLTKINESKPYNGFHFPTYGPKYLLHISFDEYKQNFRYITDEELFFFNL